MNTSSSLRHRLLALPLLGIVALADIVPTGIASISAITTVAVTLGSATDAQALPVHRVTRRTTRRVVRRHMFTMPAAAVAVTFGPYRYFRYGGIYYYPYMIGGRTTYIEIDVDTSGKPMTPPPAAQVELEIDIH